MKKFLQVFALVFSLALTGCGSKSAGSTSAKKVSIEKQVIYDQNGVTLTVTGTTIEEDGDFKVNYDVENNYGEALRVRPAAIIVNGFTLSSDNIVSNNGGKEGVASGETKSLFFGCDADTFTILDTNTVQQIDTILEFVELGTNEIIATTDLISLQTSAYESIDTTRTGEVLMEQNDIRITGGKYLTLSENNDAMVVYVENLGDTDLSVELWDLSVDGTELDCSSNDVTLSPNSILPAVVYGEFKKDDTTTLKGLANAVETEGFETVTIRFNFSDEMDGRRDFFKKLNLSVDENQNVVPAATSAEGLPALLDDVVYDQNDVKITVESIRADSDNAYYPVYCELYLTAENNTDSTIGIYSDGINGITSINSYEILERIEGRSIDSVIEIEPNTTTSFYIFVYKQFMDELQLESFSTLHSVVYFDYSYDNYYYGRLTTDDFTIHLDGQSDVPAFSTSQVKSIDGLIFYEPFLTFFDDSPDVPYIVLPVENTADTTAIQYGYECKVNGQEIESPDIIAFSNSKSICLLACVNYNSDTGSYEAIDVTTLESLTFQLYGSGDNANFEYKAD